MKGHPQEEVTTWPSSEGLYTGALAPAEPLISPSCWKESLCLTLQGERSSCILQKLLKLVPRQRKRNDLWRRSTRCGPFASEKHAEADSLQSLHEFSCDLPGRGRNGRPVGAWRWLSSSSSEKLTCRVSFRWQPRWSFLWEAFLGPRAGQISSLKVHLSRHVCVSLGIPRRWSESCLSWHPRKSRSSNSPLTVEAEEHFCKADEDVLSAL